MVRYLAYRTLTKQWIHRDLPLREATWGKTLSGAMTLTANIPSDLMGEVAEDGMRLFEDWGTTIVREDDNGALSHAGIVQPQTQWEVQQGVLNCVGPVGYFKGTIYDSAKTWGPDPAKKIERPDPIVIVRDLVAYVQAVKDRNVGITVTGATSSPLRIGTNEEPYRLMSWEQPDIGSEIDTLAALTPFDYEERVAWTDATKATVNHTMYLGVPRVGTRRTDLVLEQDTNMRGPIPVASNEGFCNDVMGIGNGEGSTLITSRATKSDGRLRRTRVLTDKTATQAVMDGRVSAYLEAQRTPIDIAQVTVDDHPNAPVASINVGDDVRTKGYTPSYGEFDVWLRVLAINGSDADPHQVVLSTSLGSGFSYIATQEVSS